MQLDMVARHVKYQRGSALLESLVALVIFSLGVIALMGLQANAAHRLGDTKYRFDASFLANELIGEMWASPSSIATFNCGDPCTTTANTQLTAWLARVQTVLPGVYLDGSPGSQTPGVVVVSDPSVGNQVTITLRWKVSQGTGAAHSVPVVGKYSAVAYVNGN
jgi:type IV pilus assembly protein PilV